MSRLDFLVLLVFLSVVNKLVETMLGSSVYDILLREIEHAAKPTTSAVCVLEILFSGFVSILGNI
jgi:hypothetical protein